MRPFLWSGLSALTLTAFACSGSDHQQGSGGIYNQPDGAVYHSGTGGVGSPPPATCYNGVVDPGEQCDGTNLNNATCASATINAQPNGTLACNSNCTFDISGCSSNGNPTGAGGTSGSGGSGGTMGVGGTTSGTGATTSTGGTTSSGGTNPTSVPTPTQTCPNLATGTVAFKGKNVSIWTGAGTGGPLLLYWHATGTNSQEVVSAFGQAAIDDITSHGGVVASFIDTYATGTNTGNNVWYTDDFITADEVVACAVQQKNIDKRRIFSAGYSAGGLQTGTMSFLRSGYIASVVIYSGGAIITTPYQDPSNTPPALCAHGASGTNFNTSDYFILDFATACLNYEDSVKQRGSLAIDCNDGSTHVDVAKRFAVGPEAWQFLKDHPYGVKPEPYTSLPSTFPSYCAIH